MFFGQYQVSSAVFYYGVLIFSYNYASPHQNHLVCETYNFNKTSDSVHPYSTEYWQKNFSDDQLPEKEIEDLGVLKIFSDFLKKKQE